MPTVRFTANLRRHLPVADVEVEATTVRQALDRVFDDNPRLRSYLLDDQGRLRRHVNVFVGNRSVADRQGLSDPVEPTTEISVMQALSGG